MKGTGILMVKTEVTERKKNEKKKRNQFKINKGNKIIWRKACAVKKKIIKFKSKFHARPAAS